MRRNFTSAGKAAEKIQGCEGFERSRWKRCSDVPQLLGINNGNGENKITTEDHSSPQTGEFAARHTSELDSAKTLALLQYNVAGEVVRAFLVYNPRG